ncbi:MAG: DEAD/DEAH box helicase family protein [Candidatus Dadabacteria bacterium]|nr:DEAD/DEAH box helicase family protein [Candidatus Dadabacteria bacterium]MDE0477735.1 DEAD/DEAH box helicase family protein [Candidatus Dadabacteria bacterium]
MSQKPENSNGTGGSSESAKALNSALARWRVDASGPLLKREYDKGKAFERLCEVFLTHDPVQSMQYESPVPWEDWAERHGMLKMDTGVDLVAKLRNEDGWCAIQCKFYAEGKTIPKAEIDSFLSASGSEHFRRRLIIDTTGRGWSKNAEDTLRRQAVPVSRIGLSDLRRTSIRWEDYLSAEKIQFKPEKTLRGYQKKALEKATSGLSEPQSRGKMIMACGTGKTLTSLRVAEEIAGPGCRVLYMVPSLALMSQTVREWAQDKEIPIRAFAVCSDSQVGKRRIRQDDLADIDALDLVFPATTDPEKLAEKTQAAAADAPEAMIVVFATYQSSSVIEQAQKDCGLPNFDLAVCDEAHRTAGAFSSDTEQSNFVRIHRDEYIKTERRLYMTATPKVYAESARTRAGNLEAELCSMEDESIYGPVLYEIGFGDAVELGLLSDYKVLVLVVGQDEVSRVIHRSLANEENKLELDDNAKLLGCWRALAKIDKDEFPEEERKPMRRAIAFCNRIKTSEQVERNFANVIDEYREHSGLSEHRISARHVDGSFNASRRSELLDWLADEGGWDECRVLTNARCLSEGVDVPTLDAILFMHPRKSQIEVVQAVGRVMRTSPGKNMGYVVLPVVIPSGVAPEDALSDDKRFQVVWQTLNAIRSHDERFEGILNLIEQGSEGDRIGIITLSGWTEPRPDSPVPRNGRGDDTNGRPNNVHPIPILFEGLPEAIRAKIVEKCGDRKYWDEWASDVADIAGSHIARIRAIVESGDAEREIFREFVTELRDDLNEGVTEDDAIEMLAQHMVTGPVFDALFGDAAFVSRNSVSRGMQTVLDVLEPKNIKKESENLDDFYASVRRRVEGASTAEARQKIIVELYDKFFRNAFPLATQKLGIVYTPVEIVDFIIRSVNDVLSDEFGSSLGTEGVHILDPFTGTGTFITRLLQSELIAPGDIQRKYENEIHANEITLLAYYIAAVNIESVYHSVANREDYESFKGICLTDTFEMHEGKPDLYAQIMPQNSDRRTRQKKTDIRVIMGNPPWSAGQKSANDNAQNQSYETLDGRIAESYAAHSSATNKNSLYDSYIRAIRWSSDRIGKSGVIGFVTNAGWLDGSAMDGMRKCLAEEFSSVYVFHLRGNARTQGEQRRKEKDNVFGGGSRAPVAITILVKNPEAEERGRIFFHDIGDYLSREKKTEIISKFRSIKGIYENRGWSRILPDKTHDWINQRDPEFNRFLMMGSKDKEQNSESRAFANYSRGIATGRDAWCYNFSAETLKTNIQAMIEFYNSELARYETERPGTSKQAVDNFVNNDPKRISWTTNLKNDLSRAKVLDFSEGRIASSIYRPFTRQWLYFSRRLNERVYQIPHIFPHEDAENKLICVTGVGAGGGFSALMVDSMPDIQTVFNGQCFPLYLYEKPQEGSLLNQKKEKTDRHGYVRRDAITEDTLLIFQEAYGTEITRPEIFNYIYGLLHVPVYRDRFANNLSKQLPNVLLATDKKHFYALTEAGEKLGNLHTGFDRVEPWPIEFSKGGWKVPEEILPDKWFRVNKMKLAGSQNSPDRTSIFYNDNITVCGIPEEAWEYEVNGKPALKWVMERQCVSPDAKSGIMNDANIYATETAGDPSYPLKLLAWVIRVSIETTQIIKSLPGPKWREIDPEKVTKKADDKLLTALDSDEHGGSPATASVEEKPRFKVADSDEVDAAIAKRKGKIQPILDYLKDK